jgi:predicted dehydrogenase
MTQKALIIGCGKIAGGFNKGPDDPLVLTHALAYTRHPEFKLVAACDPDESARNRFIETWGFGPGKPNGPAVCNSLDDALRGEHYDIASVCTPTHTHIDILEQLLETDIPKVFCEKPLGGDPAKARMMAEKYAEAGKALAVNFTRRWDQSMAELRDEIAAGEWGEIRNIVGWYCRGVMNNGTHMIDLVSFLCGATVGPVSPSVKRVIDDNPGDPTVSASLHVMGTPFALVACDGRDYARFELTLTFSKAVIEILEGGLYTRRRAKMPSAIFPGSFIATERPRRATKYGEAFLRALDEFAEWEPGSSLSSDAFTALPAIDMANEMQTAVRMGLAA